MAMKILIVDDEELARQRLQNLVSELYPSAECYEAKNGIQALAQISQSPIDIALLDIRMPEMDGLEVAHHISRLARPVSVVFTTAFDEHALSAFNTHAVDYLLKPIRQDRLRQALERAAVASHAKIQALQNITGTRREFLSSIIKQRTTLIPVRQVIYLRAEDKYVMAYWQDQEALISDSLRALEQEFFDIFVRVHRHTLVAVEYIHALQKISSGHELLLRDYPTPLIVSRRHVRTIKQRIDEISK